MVAPHPAFIRLVPMREENDCVIACIATYFCITYEDALRAAMLAVPNLRKEGYTTKQIRRIAEVLGFRLRLNKKKWDLYKDVGVMMLRDHVAILWKGVVWDPNGTLWEVDHYLRHYNYEVTGLFVKEKDTHE